MAEKYGRFRKSNIHLLYAGISFHRPVQSIRRPSSICERYVLLPVDIIGRHIIIGGYTTAQQGKLEYGAAPELRPWAEDSGCTDSKRNKMDQEQSEISRCLSPRVDAIIHPSKFDAP